ncbi:MAG: response regulator [Candidatus Marinimicrobia bacterium]|nr:response regulator [Candidatus Neomarinimicrobiota bacterium]
MKNKFETLRKIIFSEKPNNRFSIEEIRRFYVLVVLLYIGMSFLFLLAILAYIQDNKLVAATNSSFFSLLIFFMLRLRKTWKTEPISLIGTILIGFHFIFLFINGAIDGTAVVWVYVYPLVAIFLLGLKRGMILSLALISIITLSFALSKYIPFHYVYNPNLILRIIPSYLTVTLFTLGWEKARIFSQKRAEEARKEAEKANQAKSEFLSNMSHEIRTPLNSIIGFNELLTREISGEKAIEYLNSIKISSKNLLKLINDILDLSKIEAGKMKVEFHPVNINYLFQEIIQIFSHQTREKNLNFQVRIDPKLKTDILIDETRLRQILLNLVGNAVKFTPTGSIYLCFEIVSQKDDSVDIQISVTDTGIGIHPEQQEQIFEAFHQHEGQSVRQYGGTGLGLAICLKLVTMMNGTIELKSELNKGSLFILRFFNIKTTPRDIPASQDSLKTHNIKFHNEKVFVLDDLDSNLHLIEEILSPLNLSVTKFKSGNSLIEFSKETIPDIILLDIKLSESNEIEIATRLREIEFLQNLPIIALTASIDKNLHALLTKPLFHEFILKPFEPVELVKILSRYLNPDGNVLEKEKSDENLLTYSDKCALKQRFGSLVEKLIETMLIEDISKFADEIYQRGLKEKNQRYTRFAESLKTDCDNFLIMEITQKLKQIL